MKLIYSDEYSKVDIGEHIFPVLKYRLIKEELLEEGIIKKNDFIEPEPIKDEELLLVHTEDYIKKLKEGSLSFDEELRLEIPYSPLVYFASKICVNGTFITLEFALREGIAVHIGGGFHHAYPDHGEGFCVLNDIAVAVKKIKKEGKIKKVVVIDCDLHQGNGTAFIFKDDPDTFTFSIHQENLYPVPKEKSDFDIGLKDGTGDDEYMYFLEKNIPKILDEFKPDACIYQAGVDPYKEDQLGNLNLTKDGLKRRNEFIIENLRKRNIPTAITLGGGYSPNILDTVSLHIQTIKTAIKKY